MKPLLELAPFLAVAVAAHVGAFALLPQGGASAGGEGGSGQITLEGGNAGVAAMVAAWEQSPAMSSPPEAPTLADTTDTTDALPQTIPAAPPLLPALQPLSPPALPPDIAADFAPPASPPPPMIAQPPERSPYPPARPAPSRAAQANAPQRSQAQPGPPPPAAAAPAQQASGTGAQGHEGQAGQSRQSSHARADTGGLVAQWGGAVRAAVQRQQRHPATIRTGGTVLLRLEVRSDGRLLGASLHQSSGHAALDQAALDAARRATIPAAPQGLNGSFQFNLPIRFRG